MQSGFREVWPGQQLTIVHSRSVGTRWISQSRPSLPHHPTASSRGQRTPKVGKSEKKTQVRIFYKIGSKRKQQGRREEGRASFDVEVQALHSHGYPLFSTMQGKVIWLSPLLQTTESPYCSQSSPE